MNHTPLTTWTARSAFLLVSAFALGCGTGSDARESAADTTATEAARDGGHPAARRLELTDEQIKAAGLQYGVATRGSSGGVLEATAQIEPAPTRFARVGARVAGRVTEVRVAEGDPVRAGQVLATIESPELGRATGEYLAELAAANVARETAEREQALFERKISSEREWREAEAEAIRSRALKEAAEATLHALGLTDADLRTLQADRHFASIVRVRSPIGGIVAARGAEIGQAVEPGDSLIDVVDLREVALAIDVYEQAIGQVHKGQEVEVRTAGTGDRVFQGRVASVGGVVERASRSIKVRVLLPNPDLLLRPGTFANVRLLGSRQPAAIDSGSTSVSVPAAAIQRDGGETFVFLKVGPRAFEPRVVAVGQSGGETTALHGGVDPGDTVVTTGSFVLKSELKREQLGEGDEH